MILDSQLMFPKRNETRSNLNIPIRSQFTASELCNQTISCYFLLYSLNIFSIPVNAGNIRINVIYCIS